MARESEVKAHPPSGFHDEDENLSRKSMGSPVFLQSPLKPLDTEIKSSPAGVAYLNASTLTPLSDGTSLTTYHHVIFDLTVQMGTQSKRYTEAYSHLCTILNSGTNEKSRM